MRNGAVRRILLGALLLAAALAVDRAQAQYYSWGADAPARWSRMGDGQVSVVYPDTAAMLARRILLGTEAVRSRIGEGFTYAPLRIPFVVHARNAESNGLVMWMPKRVEFLSTPDVSTYAMSWYKQLIAHEYRHAVQYNNLNRGVIRALSYLLGEQGSTVGLLLMPLWAMEGDAVLSETQFATFGRAMQPSFTIEYRAMSGFHRTRRNTDKWFCGSYREHIPDHYKLGYQLTAYAWTRYGENVWDSVVRFAVRNPYMLATTRIGLKRYYGTTVDRLFRETFDELDSCWLAHARQPDSAEPLTPLDPHNYTRYAHPLATSCGRIVALRRDYDKPSRLVEIDPLTGGERLLRHTGSVATPLSEGGGRLWWSEYRRSPLFEERVTTRLCYMDLSGGRPRTVRGVRDALYPVPVGDDGLAWVEYSPDGCYAVVLRSEGRSAGRFAVPELTEVHGLAWDDATRSLYLLATDHSGMWIGAFDPQGALRRITEPTFATLSALRAKDGVLYFGSIASGKDEAWSYDLARKSYRRLTASRYGSFSPSPFGRKVLVTTYDRRGYAVAVQRLDPPLADTLRIGRMPRNLLNPPRVDWGVPKLDTLQFAPADLAESERKHPARRYRKGTHLLHLHSWAPAAFDPFAAVDEHEIDLNLGVTLLSQNLLSSTEAYALYGWNRHEGSIVQGAVRYDGLGVRLEASARYGGNRQSYSLAQVDPATGQLTTQPPARSGTYHSFAASATLPLLLDAGYHTRRIALAVGWSYSNGEVADLGAIRYDAQTGTVANLAEVGYRRGLHKLSFTAGYSDQVQSAYRNVAPPWAYTLRAGYSLNPFNSDFSDLVSTYVKVWTPGFFRNNSLSVAAAYQTSVGGYRFPGGLRPLGYRTAWLLPRGFDSSQIENNNYVALSVDYQFPLCYPEGGIPSVLFVKRIRLNVGVDGAQFRTLDSSGARRRRIGSAGCDLLFDLNLLRLPDSGTATVGLSLYAPSSGGVWFSASVGLPF